MNKLELAILERAIDLLNENNNYIDNTTQAVGLLEDLRDSSK